MKKILLFCLLVACLDISGQQINQASNSYRNSDILEKKQLVTPGFSLHDTDGVWRLEDAVFSKQTYNTEHATEADTIMTMERGNRTYYRQEDGKISIIGSENALEVMSYDMPETWLKFPMQQGDSVYGYFSGTGRYCDRLFMRRFGTYKTKADALGKLMLPDGDTLQSVIRLHTERVIGTVTAPIDTMKYEIPAFTPDSIIRHMTTDTAKVYENIYRWYAEGYRYPVLEARTVSCGKAKLSEEVCYCPPEMLQQLVLDEENRKVRARIAGQGADIGNASLSDRDNIHGHNGRTDGLRYHIDRDENSGTVTINYSSNDDGVVSAVLASSQGYVYRRTSKNDGSSLVLDYNGLPSGQYIIRIATYSESYAEKFNVR